MEARQVKGNTWMLRGNLTIPFYRLNAKEVVLLDTGYADRNREPLDAFLRSEGLRVAAVLGSHIHNDHAGNLAYYQEKDGAEILLPLVEAAALSAPWVLKTMMYNSATLPQVRSELSHLLVRVDRSFPMDQTEITVCGVPFGLLPLPGHTLGHTGVVTPDGVLYAADALMDEAVLAKSKLPTTMCWSEDLKSKEKLRQVRYDGYILAHNGYHDDIQALLDANIADKHLRAEQVAALLGEGATISELEGLAWEAMGMNNTKTLPVVIFRRNLQCAVDYLVETGAAQVRFEAGVTRYARA